MKLKQRPEDFSVVESYRFDEAPSGEHYVYRMDKQKLSTLQAVERLCERFRLRRRDVSFCGLKDKQGRTEQLIAVRGKRVDLQDPDLRLTFLGRSAEPLSARNITSNRFSVIVRDLGEEDVERMPESVAEVSRVGVVNFFDSQRFGFVKHGQGFIARDLLRGDLEGALKALIARPSPLDRTDDARVKRWIGEHWGEWTKRCPYPGFAKYRAIYERLIERPRDFGYALLAVDRRTRAMIVFEYQSALWNEAVSRYLEAKVPPRDLVKLRYQLGELPFPRALPPELVEAWRDKTFPLLGPDSTFDDPEVRLACEATLAKHRLTLEKLQVTRLEAFHFKHEERPLLVFPGKLRASEGKPDEENGGRSKVVLSFTLPPGAYATLVVRRTLWFATEEHQQEVPRSRPPRPERERRRRAPRQERARDETSAEAAEAPETPAAKAPQSEKAPPTPKPKPKGFLERQREKKEARRSRRSQS